MWAHFFGAPFTNGVDDLGPHNPPSHPEVLDILASSFIASGFDVKQLVHWMTSTDAYRLSSRFGPQNRRDDPREGEPPLFSRHYVRPMTAEQLIDSLLVATRAHQVGIP